MHGGTRPTLTVDETQKLSEVTGFLVRQESLAVLPVSETETFLSGNTTEIDDQTEERMTMLGPGAARRQRRLDLPEQDQSGQGENLDQTEPELDLLPHGHQHNCSEEA